MSLCSCTTGVKNFGQPNCVGILERPEKLAFVQTFADDGTANKIASTDTINDTFVSGLINQADNSKKWYPSPVINQVNDTRGENNTFEIDGFEINVSEGVRTMAFTVIDGAHPKIADAFNSMGCRDMSFYVWSVTGQIGGNDRVAGELRPFRIKKKTMQAIYQAPNKENEAPAMVMVKFAISDLEDDSNIAFINPGTGANDVQVDITSYVGLIDVVMGAATGITTTGFTVPIDLIYGSVFDKQPFKGGVLGDFSLAEISPTPGAIVITSVTESSDGVYDFVIPLQTSGDVLRLTFSKTAYYPAGTIDITIP